MVFFDPVIDKANIGRIAIWTIAAGTTAGRQGFLVVDQTVIANGTLQPVTENDCQPSAGGIVRELCM